ncbi:MAG: hypothetical protein JST85_22895 [Acidobacteria bacterium]|nr:hypothetical protein [Acidobacteriota bacterium]
MPAINYQDRIRTLDGDMYIEDVPEKTPIGRAYREVLKASEELAKVNIPYEKYRRKEDLLQAKVEAADIENTSPEEFAHAKAELELTARAVQKLKPEVLRLARIQQLAGENLAILQGQHSAAVNKYKDRGNSMLTSEENALKREILSNYSEPETGAAVMPASSAASRRF